MLLSQFDPLAFGNNGYCVFSKRVVSTLWQRLAALSFLCLQLKLDDLCDCRPAKGILVLPFVVYTFSV